MAPSMTQRRYPKRKRATVNYEIDQSVDGDLDLEDDGNVSEELGEDSTASASSANSINAQHRDAITVAEVDSEFEDATFGSRRIKKVGHSLEFHSHKLLMSNSVKSFRSPRPSLNPGSSVLPSSSRSDSCKPSPRLDEALRLFLVLPESPLISDCASMPLQLPLPDLC